MWLGRGEGNPPPLLHPCLSLNFKTVSVICEGEGYTENFDIITNIGECITDIVELPNKIYILVELIVSGWFMITISDFLRNSFRTNDLILEPAFKVNFIDGWDIFFTIRFFKYEYTHQHTQNNMFQQLYRLKINTIIDILTLFLITIQILQIECINIAENERIQTQGRPVRDNLCVK